MGERARFTTGRIAGFTCPGGKDQAFLWHQAVPQLGLRAKAIGSKA